LEPLAPGSPADPLHAEWRRAPWLFGLHCALFLPAIALWRIPVSPRGLAVAVAMFGLAGALLGFTLRLIYWLCSPFSSRPGRWLAGPSAVPPPGMALSHAVPASCRPGRWSSSHVAGLLFVGTDAVAFVRHPRFAFGWKHRVYRQPGVSVVCERQNALLHALTLLPSHRLCVEGSGRRDHYLVGDPAAVAQHAQQILGSGTETGEGRCDPTSAGR